MRLTLKFLHTLASCGLIGGLVCYGLVLVHAPAGDPTAYAAARTTVALLCSHLLVPSMALAIFTGLLSMAVHRPFQERRWVWAKAALGLSMFEATLGFAQSKANEAAALARRIASGEDQAAALAATIAYEWDTMAVIMALAVANIVLGVWRPILKRRAASLTQASATPS